MELFVTTTLKPTEAMIGKALAISRSLKVPYLPRGKQTLEQLFWEGGHILMVSREGLSLLSPEGAHFFHPSMAKVRIKSLINGNPDQMINAMALEPGDEVLDCTLGLGSDALVAAFKVGAGGVVTGLEKVPVLALILKEGLQNAQEEAWYLREAMSRIRVLNADYAQFLSQCPDKSYDVVYFDPMFRVPQEKTSAFVPLRKFADPAPLQPEAVKEAIRVARKRVVLKERRQSKEFTRLGFNQVAGGKYSPIAYGIIEV